MVISAVVGIKSKLQTQTLQIAHIAKQEKMRSWSLAQRDYFLILAFGSNRELFLR